MIEIDFQPIGKRVSVSPDASLYEAALQAGITLTSACGGQGNCGQCRVRVLAGDVSAPTPDEQYILTDVEIFSGERLACCTYPSSDVRVHIPTESLLVNARLQIESSLQAVPVDPVVAAFAVAVPPPTLADLHADVERIAAAIPRPADAPPLWAEPLVIRQLSTQARAYDWRMTVYVREDEIVGIAPPESPPLGLAVDLGTTKIAAFLLNLATGAELAAAGALNPQIGYGEDVISRLSFARRSPEGADILADAVYATLNDLLGELVEQAGATREQVADACIVGNTAMTHLLLRLPTDQLARAPYVPACLDSMDVKARDLGLSAAPGAYVHVLPGIGGFVGADHVAMVMASALDQAERLTVGIDIGTNTEITLAGPGMSILASASCASGPAFEGAHISDGMRAASGAIEAIRFDAAGVQLKTVDHAPPIGMCGSGIIDAVAELRRWRVINERGRFQKDNPRIRTGRSGPELLLAPAAHSGSGRDVVITQKDVNEIQLAKGAVRAGLDVLMQATGIAPADVQEVIIAGAFGSFLNIASALDAGLLPRYPNAVYRQVGNASAVGAKWALLSRQERARARRIAAGMRYVELTVHPGFNRLFALGMLFPSNEELSHSEALPVPQPPVAG
ncbi:MAG: DUF4445 domain-containing protein [Anaerolineae bacterium]|nr:DUF4445 domain-containing protein [Anaerolineae bacterium]